MPPQITLMALFLFLENVHCTLGTHQGEDQSLCNGVVTRRKPLEEQIGLAPRQKESSRNRTFGRLTKEITKYFTEFERRDQVYAFFQIRP